MSESFNWRLTAKTRDLLLDVLSGEKVNEKDRQAVVADLTRLAHAKGGSSDIIEGLTPNLRAKEQEELAALVADATGDDEEAAFYATRRLEALRLVAEIGRSE